MPLSQGPQQRRQHPPHPYQDAALPIGRRVEDLLSRMTLEEKAGQLFHSMLTMNADGTPVTETDGSLLPYATPN